MCCSIFSHNNCTPPQTIFGKPNYLTQERWDEFTSKCLTIAFVVIPLLNLRNLEMTTNHSPCLKFGVVSLIAISILAGGICIGLIEAIIRTAQGILTLPLPLFFSCCSCECAKTLSKVPGKLVGSAVFTLVFAPTAGLLFSLGSLCADENLEITPPIDFS